jgi:hydroxyacylglutathione hydrolase
MIQQIKENIWKISFDMFGSNVYLIKLKNKNVLIDTGSKWNKNQLMEELRKLKIKVSDITTVIITHEHFDHTGNINLFKKAEIYAGKEDFKEEKIKDINKLKIKELEIIKTPGHSPGGICVYMPKEKILFSGDTIFEDGFIGRTDLPGGSYEKIIDSIKKIKQIDYKILLPGHDV